MLKKRKGEKTYGRLIDWGAYRKSTKKKQGAFEPHEGLGEGEKRITAPRGMRIDRKKSWGTKRFAVKRCLFIGGP